MTDEDPVPPSVSEAAAEREKRLEAAVFSLGRSVERTTRELDRLDKHVTALADRIGDLGPGAGGIPDDEAGGEAGPCVRSWLLADDPAQAEADLADLATWLWQVYLWWPDGWLSSCWLWHPEVIEELSWLRVAHADAYHPETGSSLRVADWHERHRPGVARRVRAVLGKCELSRHIPFNGRPVEVTPPGPPALARHVGEVATVWVGGAGLEGVVRAAGPQPRPEQLAEADAYQRALYGRRR
jgi:hypothetical protein